MKNFECVMESEKKFLLVHVKSENIQDANIKFCELAYAISRLEDFKIIEIRESWDGSNYFSKNAKIIRVREK